MRPRNSLVVVAIGVVLACTASAGMALGGRTLSPAGGTRLRGDARSPSWSPDGKQIAFAYVGSGQPGPYRIVRRSSKPGGRVHTVVAAPHAKSGIGQLQWATSGRILFLAYPVLKSVDPHSGKPKLLYSNEGFFADAIIVSPNRKSAAIDVVPGTPGGGGGGVALVKLRSARGPVLVGTPIFGVWALAFSPDSRQLILGSPAGLMAARIPGGTPVPLAQSGLPGASLVPSDAQQVQWSPGGRRVAYLEGRDLEVVSTAGTSPPRIVASCPSLYSYQFDFSWAPTSKWIAYDCVGGDSGRLSTVRPNGTHRTHLLRLFAGYTGWYEGEPVPQWSPDGSRLLVMASGEVWTTRANGHGLTRLG